MEALLNRIETLKQELNSLLPITPVQQKALDEKLRLEFNYNSNHIEGNTLTYDETKLFLIRNKTQGNHDAREYQEMKAHDLAFSLVTEWAKHKDLITETDIRNLHKILLVEPYWSDAVTPDGKATKKQITVGDYKQQPNSVQLPSGEIFEYTSVRDTPIEMAALMEWFVNEENQQQIHPLATAALFHYKFVRIHPFDDGNGRISRLLMNYILMRHGYPVVVIKSADKKNYLFALGQADSGNVDSFVRYIGEQLIWSFELYIKAAKGETLEEEDDLEKQISIWKKNVTSTNVSALHKDNEIVYSLYNECFLPLFQDFISIHQQYFDVFRNYSILAFRNNGSGGGLDWLSEDVTNSILTAQSPFVNAGEAPQEIVVPDTLNSLQIQIELNEYKYNYQNPFSFQSSLLIRLDAYKYRVEFGGNKMAEKNYYEQLTELDKKLILRTCRLSVFEHIKTQSEKK